MFRHIGEDATVFSIHGCFPWVAVLWALRATIWNICECILLLWYQVLLKTSSRPPVVSRIILSSSFFCCSIGSQTSEMKRRPEAYYGSQFIRCYSHTTLNSLRYPTYSWHHPAVFSHLCSARSPAAVLLPLAWKLYCHLMLLLLPLHFMCPTSIHL